MATQIGRIVLNKSTVEWRVKVATAQEYPAWPVSTVLSEPVGDFDQYRVTVFFYNHPPKTGYAWLNPNGLPGQDEVDLEGDGEDFA